MPGVEKYEPCRLMYLLALFFRRCSNRENRLSVLKWFSTCVDGVHPGLDGTVEVFRVGKGQHLPVYGLTDLQMTATFDQVSHCTHR